MSKTELLKAPVMDSVAETVFDDITLLAIQIAHAQVAMINFNHVDKFWVKSKVGIDLVNSPRDLAFCSKTILQDGPLVISDLSRDVRFRDNALVKEKKLLSYAGVPLKTRDGHNIGTLCVGDHVPRNFSTTEIKGLETLAKQVIAQLELSKSLKEVSRERSVFHFLFENIKEIVFSTDKNGHWSYLSPSWAQVVGHQISPCLGAHVLDYAHPDDRSEYDRNLSSLMKREKDDCKFQVRYLCKDGTYKWVEIFTKVTLAEDGEVSGTTGVISDIHEQRLAHDQFKEEKNKLDLITNNLGDVVWMRDPSRDTIVYIGPSYEKVWERSCSELYADPASFIKSIHPDDQSRVLAAIPLQVTDRYEVTYRILCANGAVKWIQDKSFPIKNESGDVYRVVGIASDITEKIEQQEKFKTIVNNIPIFLAVYDDKGFEWVNSSFEKVLGYSLEDAQLADLMEKLYPDSNYRQTVLDFMSSPKSESWMSFETKTKQGEMIPTSWMNVKLSSGKCIGIGQDISKQKEQERLIEEQRMKIVSAAKMSSLGEMAAGVAHEINNPLTIIIGRIQVLRQMASFKDLTVKEITEFCDKIESTVGRISKIITGLKTFARDGSQDSFERVNVHHLVQETLGFCEARFKNNQVKLIVDEFPKDLEIDCRYVQISQVILNLLNNAFDANISKSNSWVKLSVSYTQSDISIAVEDSGPGIPKEIQEKIMQPFFTTKEVGKGTGLGLSLSRGFIESHDGSLRLDTKAVHTRFVVKLPRWQKPEKIAS